MVVQLRNADFGIKNSEIKVTHKPLPAGRLESLNPNYLLGSEDNETPRRDATHYYTLSEWEVSIR